MRAFINFCCITLFCILARTVQAGKISKSDLKSSDEFDYGAHFDSLKAGSLIKDEFETTDVDAIPVTCKPSSANILTSDVIMGPSNPQVQHFWKENKVFYNETDKIEPKKVEEQLFECSNEEKLKLPFYVAIFKMSFKDDKPDFTYAQTYAMVQQNEYARVWIRDLDQMKIEETE